MESHSIDASDGLAKLTHNLLPGHTSHLHTSKNREVEVLVSPATHVMELTFDVAACADATINFIYDIKDLTDKMYQVQILLTMFHSN